LLLLLWKVLPLPAGGRPRPGGRGEVVEVKVLRRASKVWAKSAEFNFIRKLAWKVRHNSSLSMRGGGREEGKNRKRGVLGR
jgi:hypothetical protein